MKEKKDEKKQKIDINIFFDDNGENIIEILESDFANFANRYLKQTVLNNN